MGCGGSKDDVKASPSAQGRGDEKKKPEKEPSSPKKDSPEKNKQDKFDDDDSDADGNKKTNKELDVRQELVQATESRDVARLQKAIVDYERSQLSNTPELVRARRVLVSLHEQELQEAIDEQKLERLEAAIDAANSSTVSPELHEGETLQEAEAMRSLLRRLKLYLHKVLELKPMTVSEIHSYKRPRPLVHAVMKATYLILGEQERLLREWEYIQSLLRRQGRGSIIRRIKEFNPEHMKKAKVNRAEGHLKHCSKDKVRQTSAGAGTFYNWSYNIIKEGQSTKNEKT